MSEVKKSIYLLFISNHSLVFLSFTSANLVERFTEYVAVWTGGHIRITKRKT